MNHNWYLQQHYKKVKYIFFKSNLYVLIENVFLILGCV